MKRRDGITMGYTKEDALEAIQNFLVEEGRLPTSRDADKGKHGLPTVKVFKRLYGSFASAMHEYNLPVDRRGGHNRGETTPCVVPPKKKRRKSRIQPSKSA